MRAAGVSALSVFGGDGHWFLYAETKSEAEAQQGSGRGDGQGSGEEGECSAFEPERFFSGAESVLAAWPGKPEHRLFVPMADIFHYQRPANKEHWRRKSASESFGRVARLKPDKVSSYVFYHYQYQEEKPGDGDKYGIIGLHGNLLFFYAERPSTVEAPPYEGALNTRNTSEDWGAVMQPHFIEWQGAGDGQRVWMNLERAFDLRLE